MVNMWQLSKFKKDYKRYMKPQGHQKARNNLFDERKPFDMGGRDSSRVEAPYSTTTLSSLSIRSLENTKNTVSAMLSPIIFLYIQTVKREITIKHTGTHVDLFE